MKTLNKKEIVRPKGRRERSFYEKRLILIA